jgi:hypothetical protein
MVRPEHHAALRPYLHAGERLLWAGRPKSGIGLRPLDLWLIPLSLFTPPFMLYLWQLDDDPAPAFASPFLPLLLVAFGLYFLFGRFLQEAWLRSRSLYAVSDRRVIMLRTGRFARVRTIELRYLPTLELRERGGGRGTIRFDVGDKHPLLGEVPEWVPAASRVPQFLDIDGARSVYDLIAREGERIRMQERTGASLIG